MRATLAQLVDQAQRLSHLTDQLNVGEWVNQGAPETYVQQRQTVQTQAGYLRTVSQRLSADPERLSLALDAYFRLQTLEQHIATLAEGAARFQEEEHSRELGELLSRNSEAATRLRQYVMDLSVTKEQEYAVAEKEAQRCQVILNRSSPVKPEAKGKK